MSNRTLLRVSLVAVSILLTFGAASAETVIGSAGGMEIGPSDVKKLLAGLPETTRAALKSNPAPLTQAMRAELTRRLILAEATKAQYDKDPAIQADFAKLREEVLLRQWVAHQSPVSKDYPSNAEVEKAYQTLVARAVEINEVRLGQIFVAAPDGIDAQALSGALRKVADLQAKLSAKGSDFAALAMAQSEHKDSAGNGGTLDFESETSLIPEIRAAIKSMKPGDSPVLAKSAQGFHIIRVIERRPAKVKSLAEVRPVLIAELRRVRAEELERRYVAEITTKYPPAINEVELTKLLGTDLK
jgi:peptidylprolyl isomerase